MKWLGILFTVVKFFIVTFTWNRIGCDSKSTKGGLNKVTLFPRIDERTKHVILGR